MLIDTDTQFETKIRFSTQDKIGRVVVCSEHAWEHVIHGHPEMGAYENDVIEAIKHARYGGRYRDLDFDDRECVYHKNDSPPPRYVKVVIKYSVENVGEVVTAFLTDGMKPGESPIWAK